MLTVPLLLKMSLRVVMSTRPTVRSPNSAGRAPVTSDMLPMKLVSKMLPKPVTPVGQHHPVDAELDVGMIIADMQQAAGSGILRDPGACSSTFSTDCLVPCGRSWIVSWLIVSEVVPMVV